MGGGGVNCNGVMSQVVYAVMSGSPSPSPSPSPNCKPSSLSFCCDHGTPCDCSKSSSASGQCSWFSYEFCCSSGVPCHCDSPFPSPSPSPSPGKSCKWNSDCPAGEKCYYPSSSASSG